jgi:hypothetical protein
MPTFCRHNRFLERCPICSKTVADAGARPVGGAGVKRRTAGSVRGGGSSPRSRGGGLRVRHEGRAVEDGYASALVPGLRASADAERLASEVAFAAGRLAVLAVAPPGLYGEARVLAGEDLERAVWICFLSAYLCPVEGPDAFAGVREALTRLPSVEALTPSIAGLDLADVPLGPRTSHDPDRSPSTLLAYADWLRRGGRAGAGATLADGPGADALQASAFAGDPGWSPQRRFERLFERLALPGLSRASRFDLLVTLGRLSLFELNPDSLHLGTGRGTGEEDTTLAAKRVFGIGDPILLERRARTLAEAMAVPVAALDPALASWGSGIRASLGVAPETLDANALERARDVLGL